MTPFMTRVAELVDTPTAQLPEMQPSTLRPWNAGVDTQASLRSLAEQLICEANAVLAGTGERILLEDELAEDVLGFTLRFARRRARISTRRVGDAAHARFDGVGSRCSQTRELAGPEALEDVILQLLAGRLRPEAAVLACVPESGTHRP
jgi:hypothetical protein